MDTENNKDGFKCETCGSESEGAPGTCCGAEREPIATAMKCEACGHQHKSDGSCDCGCE